MLKIAGLFPHSMKHIEAAKSFRLPYWDYFQPRGGSARFPGVTNLNTGATSFGYDFSIPFVLEVEKVMVYVPKGLFQDTENVGENVLQPIANPLFRYRFPETDSIPKFEWDALAKGEQDAKAKVNSIHTTDLIQSLSRNH